MFKNLSILFSVPTLSRKAIRILHSYLPSLTLTNLSMFINTKPRGPTCFFSLLSNTFKHQNPTVKGTVEK